MIFIFGSPRSGTTLLSQSLNAHDDIVIPHETDYIIPLAYIIDRIQEPDIGRDMIYKLMVHSEYYKSGGSFFEYLSEENIHSIIYSTEYSLAKILKTIYQTIADKAGKKFGGDKSPNDILGLRILFKNNAFSQESRILHIVRDIRDVMASLHEVGWVSDLDLYFPRMWADSNLYLYSVFKSQKERYMLIRYEDLVTNPEAVLSEICRMTGVSFQKKMIDPSNRHEYYRNISHHQNLFKPITSERIGRYKKTLPFDMIENYEIQAGEAIQSFGYSATGTSMLLKLKQFIRWIKHHSFRLS